MNELHNQVARARRRLVIEQFFARSVWCLFVALAVAAVAIAVPRAIAIPGLPERWDSVWFLAALGAGQLAAAVWTSIAHRTVLDAAIEIDRRFGLRERVASSVSLTPDELNTEAGQALVKDAIRAASRIDVRDKFRVQLGRRTWLPLVPAALAFLLIVLVNPPAATSSLDPNSPTLVARQINTAAEAARKKLQEQRQRAEREKLEAAEDLFQRIEVATRDLSQRKDVDRTQAAVKFNDLAKQLQQRRQQLGGKDGLQKRLQNLKGLGDSAAAKIARAMKQADFQQAAEEAEKLAQQLRDGAIDDQAKQQLAKDLEDLEQKLDAAADAHEQAMNDLRQQIEQQRQLGDLAQAGQSQQKLDQLGAQLPQMKQLEQLASQLGQAQDGMQPGNAQQAAGALAQAARQLGQMQQEMTEREMLDQAMNDLQAAKSAMACKNCQGAGCEECNAGLAMNGKDQQTGKPGPGIGTGRGDGRTQENESAASSRAIQVRQKPGRGSAVFSGMVAGPNIKGKVAASIQQEIASFDGAPADPLTTERLPRNRREHAEEYFNRLRDGQ